MHTHVSLFEGDRNAFFEAGAEYQLSKTGRQFIAGILRHASEIAVVTNQWVNSYKRLLGGGEAPSYICWGHNNRSAMVRVPMYKPQKGVSTRDRAAHDRLRVQPLPRVRRRARRRHEGHRGGLRAAARGRGRRVDADRARAQEHSGIAPLPSSLSEAISVAEDSELLAETLGEHVFDFFLRNKRTEWQDYRTQVSAFERDRMLPVL